MKLENGKRRKAALCQVIGRICTDPGNPISLAGFSSTHWPRSSVACNNNSRDDTSGPNVFKSVIKGKPVYECLA